MKFLLDTHIWIWSVLEPEKIAPGVAKMLEDPANEKWLSPISIWELMILVEKGRVELDLDTEEWVAQALMQFPPKEAPLTIEVVLAMHKIRLPHRDPADAFLAATAKAFGLTLATSDARLLAVKGISSLPNR
jgi:PIN domain nuclease of toxin-antitoxin system